MIHINAYLDLLFCRPQKRSQAWTNRLVAAGSIVRSAP